MEQLEKLRDQLLLHQFLQDCEELHDWIQEKNVLVQEDTYRSAKTIHSKWTRHQAFQSEIASNKERLEQVQKSGEELLQSKPEMAETIQPKINELGDEFEALQENTKDKGEKLFDAKRADLYEQSCDDIDDWVQNINHEMETTPVGNDPTSVNILIQKQQMIETQMRIKSEQVQELESQAEHLERMSPEKTEEIEEKKKQVETKKEVFQFLRDVEDENIWMEEKMNIVTSEEFGSSLQDVNMLIKKNKTLKGEIDNHEPRICSVYENGQKLIDDAHPESQDFGRQIEDLKEKLTQLKENLEARNVKLLMSEKVQQFFFDANEAEAWMSEQELYMMVEDRGKDEFSAQNLMKKHEALETAVADYSNDVRQLGEVASQLTAQAHPQSDSIRTRLSQAHPQSDSIRT